MLKNLAKLDQTEMSYQRAMANFYNARYTKLSRYASSINLSLPAQSAINMFCRKTRKQLRFSCSGR